LSDVVSRLEPPESREPLSSRDVEGRHTEYNRGGERLIKVEDHKRTEWPVVVDKAFLAEISLATGYPFD